MSEEQSTQTETPTESSATVVDSGTGEAVSTTTYVNGKYDSVSALEEGYTNLHSKFGGFTGAPEAYSLDEGVEYNADHPLLATVQEIGKELNMSNEGYQKLVGAWMDYETNAIETQKAAEMEALGTNAKERLQNVSDWMGANLSEEAAATLTDNMSSAAIVGAVEELIAKTKGQKMADETVKPATVDKDKLREMRFALDEYGNRKMNNPEYRKRVMALEEQAK